MRVTILALALASIAICIFVFRWTDSPTQVGNALPNDKGVYSHSDADHATLGQENTNNREAVQTAAPPDKAAQGDVQVRVYRGRGVPVPDCVVVLNNTLSAATQDDGTAHFSVPAGTYSVRIDEARVPAGLMAPAMQGNSRPHHEVPDGYYMREVTVEPGKSAEVTLRLFAPSSVMGAVVDAWGNPIHGMMVRAQCLQVGLSGYSIDTTTDTSGIYHLDGLLPNAYFIELCPTLEDGGAPLPTRLGAAQE